MIAPVIMATRLGLGVLAWRAKRKAENLKPKAESAKFHADLAAEEAEKTRDSIVQTMRLASRAEKLQADADKVEAKHEKVQQHADSVTGKLDWFRSVLGKGSYAAGAFDLAVILVGIHYWQGQDASPIFKAFAALLARVPGI